MGNLNATGGPVVYQFFKDTFWKLFTTIQNTVIPPAPLFISSSKIHSESYLQHLMDHQAIPICCLSVLQRYILKAIYNWISNVNDSIQLFISSSKIHSESYLQRLKSQPSFATSCLSVLQRYILKAIYNRNDKLWKNIIVVYQFFKDTFWKLFTTGFKARFYLCGLFISSSKIHSESYLQPLSFS